MIPRQHVAVMGMMQEAFRSVQDNLEARAMRWLQPGPKVMQHGFDFPPVDIAADGVMENRLQYRVMFVAHDGLPAFMPFQHTSKRQFAGHAFTRNDEGTSVNLRQAAGG